MVDIINSNIYNNISFKNIVSTIKTWDKEIFEVICFDGKFCIFYVF